MEVSDSEAFWFMLESDHVNGYVATWLAETTKQGMAFEDLSSLTHIFSSIVDAKSAFTKGNYSAVPGIVIASFQFRNKNRTRILNQNIRHCEAKASSREAHSDVAGSDAAIHEFRLHGLPRCARL